MALAQYLVDTSVYSRLHRPQVYDVAAPLIERGLVASCSVIDLEIRYSTRSVTEYAEVVAERSGIEALQMDQEVWDLAAATQWQLAGHGLLRAVGIPDLLIAATAAIHGVAVLHYDRDFDHIAGVTGQEMQWVVPAGTVP